MIHRLPYSYGYLCWELIVVFALCACMMSLSSPYYHSIVAHSTSLQQKLSITCASSGI